MANSPKTQKVLERFHEIGIIPVVVLNDPKDAKPLGAALMKGGLPAAEVTFRTDAAEESIRIMAKEYPDMLVGAGTVLTTDQVDRAVAAGAKFIVAPGFDPELVKYCLEQAIPVCPGTATASEITGCVKLGLDHVKFFPAEQSGGLAKIKALSAPFPMFKVMPTGGVSLKNLADYISSPVIAACGGSYMVTADLIDNNKWDEITDLCRQSVEIVKEARKDR